MNLRPVTLAIPPLKRIQEEIPAPSPVLVRGDEAFLNRRGRNLIKVNWHRGELAWAIDLPLPPRLPAQGPRSFSLSAQGTAILASLGLAVCVYEANTTIFVAAVELASGTLRWTREFTLTDLFATLSPDVIAKARTEYSAAHPDQQPSTAVDPCWNNHVRPMEIHDALLLQVESSLNSAGASLHPQTGEPDSSAFLLALDPLTGATSGRHDLACKSTRGRAIVTASGVSVWDSQLAAPVPCFEKPPKTQLGEPLCRDTHAIVPIRTGNAWGIVIVPFDTLASPVVHLFPANPSPRSLMDRLVPLGDDILLIDGLQNIALLNAEGRLRWTAKTPPYVYSVAALPQGPIAVGTAGAGGSLFVLDRSTGHTLFKHPFPTPSVAAVSDRGGFLASSFVGSNPQTLFVGQSSRGEWIIHPLSTHVHIIHAIQGNRILHGHESLRVADLVD